MSSALDWGFFIMKLFKAGTERYRKKAVHLLHCDNSGLEASENSLQRVIFGCDLEQGSFTRVREN